MIVRNEGGTIQGLGGQGLDISDIDGYVEIENQRGTIRGYREGIKIAPGWSNFENFGAAGYVFIDNQDSGRILSDTRDAIFISDVGGDITILNNDGIIEGYYEGIQIDDAYGDITIENRGGDIYGGDNGVYITDARSSLITIDNSFGGSIEGENSYGIYINEVDDEENADENGYIVRIYNNGDAESVGGSIIGDDYAAIFAYDIDGGVFIDNSFGGLIRSWDNDAIEIGYVWEGPVTILNNNGGQIFGDDYAIYIYDVRDGIVTVDNRFGGEIDSQESTGIYIDDVDGRPDADGYLVRIYNNGDSENAGGSITGDDDAIYVYDINGGVLIDNSFGGEIQGYDDDGIEIGVVNGLVTILNNDGGSIIGDDDGVYIYEVDGGVVTVDNRSGGYIEGEDDDGIHIYDVDGVAVDGGAIVRILNNGSAAGPDEMLLAAVEELGTPGGTIIGYGDGIYIDEVSGGIFIDNSFGGTITGLNDDGIEIEYSYDGPITILNNNGGTITGADDGLLIDDARGGIITVDNSFGGTITGSGGDGIRITEADDDEDALLWEDGRRYLVRIFNNGDAEHAGGTISGSDDGIDLEDIDGGVLIDNRFGGTIMALNDDGIDISDVWEGPVTILNSNGGTIEGDDEGIRIDNVRRGLVTIDNSLGGAITGREGDGIKITEIDDDSNVDDDGYLVRIYNYGDEENEIAGGTITGYWDGIDIEDVDGGVLIDNRFGGTIIGQRAQGIDIEDIWEGPVTILNSNGGTIEGEDQGIRVDNVREGLVTIDNSLGGTITGITGDGIKITEIDDDSNVDDDGYLVRIYNYGDEENEIAGGTITGYWDGIDIEDVDGGVLIDNRFGGTIIGQRGQGIDIEDIWDGGVTILNGGLIEGESQGILIADVDGEVYIENAEGGEIVGIQSSAIRVNRADDVTIVNDGSLLGAGQGLSTAVVRIRAQSATITNLENGTIASHDGETDDLVISSITGEGTTINNEGVITGRVTLLSGDEPNTINNSGEWYTSGTNSVISLGSGFGDDVINNTGLIQTSDFTLFLGVEEFNNAGGVLSMQDGVVGDLTVLGSVINPSNFNGGLGLNGRQSTLAIDAALGGRLIDEEADRLVVEGNVTGRTAVVVNDVTPLLNGIYNPFGIEFAYVEGNTNPGDFYLANGPIDKGLFSYDIFMEDELYGGFQEVRLMNGGGQAWYLASSPDATFFELPSITTGAQDVWHTSTGAWLDRTADLRSASNGNVTPGAWLKLVGGKLDRDRTEGFRLGERVYSYDIDASQTTYGLIGGIDFGASDSESEGRPTWMFGLKGGYIMSNLDFDGSTTDIDLDTIIAGAYVSYLQGGWFVDGSVTAGFGSADYSNRAGALSATASPDVFSLGTVLDAGYRFTTGSVFIEPGVTLSYVNTSIDDMAIYGERVSFDDGSSFRGRVGVRAGGSYAMGETRYEPFIGVGLIQEFDGKNEATLLNSGLKATDDAGGLTGRFSAGLNLFGSGGVSGFVKADADLGEDLKGYGGSMGIRVTW